MKDDFTRTLRDDPTGPEVTAYLEQVLEGFAVDRHDLENEAVRQMTLAKGAATEYVGAIAQLQEAECRRDNMYALLIDAERGQGEKLTETALKHRVIRDPRMVTVETSFQNATVRMEAAKLALKLFWERGENIRALLFSRNTEMRALGAPASGGGTSSSINPNAPAAGDLTRRATAKYSKKG